MTTPEPKSDKSFWTTLPGILTGIAGIITALAALVAALNAAGILTPAPPNTPTPPAIPSPAATTPTPSAVRTNTPSIQLTFTIEPNPARRGEEVQLNLSSAIEGATVYFNGKPLPKKVLANGRTYVVTVPGDATSGFFEIEWSGGRVTSSQRLNVLP